MVLIRGKKSQLRRRYLKDRILVQCRGGAEFQTGGPPQADRDMKRGSNKDIGPKDIFEIASNSTLE